MFICTLEGSCFEKKKKKTLLLLCCNVNPQKKINDILKAFRVLYKEILDDIFKISLTEFRQSVLFSIMAITDLKGICHL